MSTSTKVIAGTKCAVGCFCVSTAPQAGRLDLVSGGAGQIAGMITERRPAKNILMCLAQEAEEMIEQLQPKVTAAAT
jgi:hypothetical protein